MSELSSKQVEAVAQLREIIDGADEDVAISVLDSVDWDVQRAADLIFGNAGNAPGPSSSSSSSRGAGEGVEEFDIDDSQQGEFENANTYEHEHEHEPEYPPRQRPAPAPNAPPTYTLIPALARPFLTLLTFPLHILSSVFKFLFSVLRIPLPQFRFMGMNLGLNLNLSGYRTLRPRPSSGGGGGGGPDRWVRELEEETGAVSIRRSGAAAKGTTSSLADPGQGSSSLTSRSAAASTSANGNGPSDDGRKYLPDFTISTYEDFLRTCQKETKIGCVILVSAEHDDVPEFKRSTLTDMTFVETLYDNDILVWGGDVRDREAWSAAQKLQATTYPFIAFLALQPRRTGFASLSATHLSTTSTSTPARAAPPPTLTVLSRHQGPAHPRTSTPLVPAGPTAPATLAHHVTTQLLPRVRPYLAQLAAHAAALQHERVLRAEQDVAFEAAKRRDKERIEMRMREEREAREAGRRREEEERREGERRAQEEAERRKREEERMKWRRWTRRVLVGAGAAGATQAPGTGTLRIAIRLPSGARLVHAFAPSSPLTALYALVDAHLIPAEHAASDDPLSPPPSSSSKTPTGADPIRTLEAHILTHPQAHAQAHKAYWGFLLLSAYPRAEIGWASDTPLSAIAALRGGGQVVVELLREKGKDREGGTPRSSLSSEKGAQAQTEDDDDGYHTEDSE